MTPYAFRRKLEQYDLTPEQAAELVGAKRRTGYYWAEHGPPYSVALVFKLMDRLHLSTKYMFKLRKELQNDDR